MKIPSWPTSKAFPKCELLFRYRSIEKGIVEISHIKMTALEHVGNKKG